MEYYVYKHIRLKDGSTFYIGKGKGDRMYSADRRNVYWKRIVEKDGGFTAKLVKENLTNDEAFDLEKKLIAEIGIDNLTNMTEGGSGGDTRKGFTEDEYKVWLENKSKAQTGKEGWWKGKKRNEHSLKVKEKHSEGAYSYDWLKNPKSEEHKQKLSEAAKNRIRPMLKCDICGMEMKTNLSRHQRGKNCKQK
jgi:hypothetical protein